MKTATYSVHCILQEDAHLPPYKGSTLRGGFARAFLRTVCAVRRSNCADCLLRQRCLYVATFEPRKASGSSATAPQPYLIEPPLDTATEYPAGSSLEFNLVLFGEANDYLPYHILALERMGQQGAGKKAEGKGPARFRITDIRRDGERIYDPREQQLLPAEEPRHLAPMLPVEAEQGTLTVRCITPLRVKHRNHLTDELPFFVLVKAVLRRISTLFAEYGGGEPDLDYPGLVRRAKDVPTVGSDLAWRDFRRYSNRQDTPLRLGGVVGNVSYSGPIGDYLPLLDLARTLHVGKQASFGLGWIDYDWEPRS